MKKARTVAIDKNEIDFMVLEYSSKDSSVLSSLGKHCKETYWKILAGTSNRPIDVRITVDKQLAMSPEVTIAWNGEKLFPASTAAKAKLTEDFRHRWPFRGTIKGIGVKNHFEVRPEHVFMEQWFLATITEQRPDGLFKATLCMPNSRGAVDEVALPAVKLENIREAHGEKKPLTIPQRSLVLEVPKQDPLHVTLSVDGHELITHFFARHTPPLPKPVPNAPDVVTPAGTRVRFQVSQDRTRVTSTVGHHSLSHFLSGDVRIVKQDATPLKRSWTFMIGPFAEHTVSIEKAKSSSVVRMMVDDTLLVESNAEDIDSKDGWWQCAFRYMGEKFMDWEVWETDVDGRALSTQGTVTHRSQYSHEVVVSFREADKSLLGAFLTIDARDFTELPEMQVPAVEEQLDCSPDALRAAYGLTVPYKVSDAAVSKGLFGRLGENLGDNITQLTNLGPLSPTNGQEGGGGFFGFFFCCTTTKPTVASDEILTPRPN